MIMELDARETAKVEEIRRAREEAEAKIESQFSFETAERTELKGAFI